MGTICNDVFWLNNNGASVLCRMMGHDFGQYNYKYKQPEARVANKTWLDNVMCTGEEKSITECPHNEWGEENCEHSQDIGIRCFLGRSDFS